VATEITNRGIQISQMAEKITTIHKKLEGKQ
jgi:hypothetical protein